MYTVFKVVWVLFLGFFWGQSLACHDTFKMFFLKPALYHIVFFPPVKCVHAIYISSIHFWCPKSGFTWFCNSHFASMSRLSCECENTKDLYWFFSSLLVFPLIFLLSYSKVKKVKDTLQTIFLMYLIRDLNVFQHLRSKNIFWVVITCIWWAI